MRNKIAPQDITQILDDVKSGLYEGVGKKPIPDKFDEQFTKLIRWYVDSDPTTRNQFRESISQEHSSYLLGYAERMASYAVRVNDKKYIEYGLAAIAIENYIVDKRDSLTIIPLLYNSLLKLEEDPQSVFLRSASYASEQISRTFLSYAQSNPKDVTIKEMGYVETDTPEGFAYKRTW